jgi:hypothetical protein
MNVMKRLWNDEAGFIVSMELMIVATVVVLGMLVGLVAIREQLVQELADVAEAISEFNQSYSYAAVIGHSSSTGGADFIDALDFCDVQDGGAAVGTSSACVDVNFQAVNPGEQ